MVEEIDSDMLRFIAKEYRKQVQEVEKITNERQEEHEEEFYGYVNNEEWDDLYSFAQQLEKDFDIELEGIKNFCRTVDSDAISEVEDEETVSHTLSSGTSQAIRMKARESEADEMLIYCDEPLSVKGIFDTQDSIYDSYGKACFIIPNQKSLEGRISVEMSETKQKIELLRVYKTDKHGLEFNHLGESNTGKKGREIETRFTKGFFAYKFISNHQEYILFSEDKLDPMSCTVNCAHLKISDWKEVGENAGLPSDLDILFAHSVEPAIKPKDDKEVRELFGEKDHDWFAEKLLGDFRHPKWFEKMNLAIFAVGEENGYPSGLVWMAETGTGKTAFQESITKALDESAGIHTGSGGTLKGLIPSFKDSPPKEGHLLKCQRVAAVDEIFNFLSQTVSNAGMAMQDVFRPMLDLIEHRYRTFSSGNGSIRGKMEGVMMATGNPSYGVSNLMEAAEKLDEAFLGRFLLYEQTDTHIQFVEDRKFEVDKPEAEMYPETDSEFISLLDYLKSEVNPSIDGQRIKEMKKEVGKNVPSMFTDIYRARYDHHMRNIVSGISKINSIIEDRDGFEVKDHDYEEAEKIFQILINSWVQRHDIEQIPLKVRKKFIPDKMRRVMEEIEDSPGIKQDELETEVDSMSFLISELSDYELVVTEDHKIYPYWHEKADGEKIKGLVS